MSARRLRPRIVSRIGQTCRPTYSIALNEREALRFVKCRRRTSTQESTLSGLPHRQHEQVEQRPPKVREIAEAYNKSGDNYLAYADGDPDRLFAFDGQFSYGDRAIWWVLVERLLALRAVGVRKIKILDLGCGPGTWLRRVVSHAHDLGFEQIHACGIDVADEQVERARALSADLSTLPGISLTYSAGDMLQPLAAADHSVDLTLCLCSVLNHLPTNKLSAVFAEISRVTGGDFVTSARTVGSTPTVCVDSLSHTRSFQLDSRNDRLDAELDNGRHVSLPLHLFCANELLQLAGKHFFVRDLVGLDLFHSRFAEDPRWYSGVASQDEFLRQLELLEKAHCREPQFIDHATHILLVGTSRADSSSGVCHEDDRFGSPTYQTALGVAGYRSLA
jgi:SAM-dependent methyltransferase